MNSGCLVTEEMREHLRESRKRHAWSYEELASQVGISWMTIKNVEQGKYRQCSYRTWRKLQAFEVRRESRRPDLDFLLSQARGISEGWKGEMKELRAFVRQIKGILTESLREGEEH